MAGGRRGEPRGLPGPGNFGGSRSGLGGGGRRSLRCLPRSRSPSSSSASPPKRGDAGLLDGLSASPRMPFSSMNPWVPQSRLLARSPACTCPDGAARSQGGWGSRGPRSGLLARGRGCAEHHRRARHTRGARGWWYWRPRAEPLVAQAVLGGPFQEPQERLCTRGRWGDSRAKGGGGGRAPF